MSNTCSIGIDIGGTKILLALLLKRDPNNSHFLEIPTNSSRGISDAQIRIVAAIEQLLRDADVNVEDVSSMGIGAPGPLNLKNNTFENPYTLPGWEGWSISDFLKNSFNVRVTFENDADMNAYGEYCVRKVAPNPMLVLTIGTGIGGSLIHGGEIFRGACGEHPEIGLIPVLESGDHCYSNIRGSLESWTSGQSYANKTRDFGLLEPGEIFTSNDPEVIRFRDNVYLAWKRGIQTYLHCYYPQEIVIAGGIAEYHFEFFKSATNEGIAESKLIDSEKVCVSKAILGKKAGAIGAAYYSSMQSIEL